MRSPAKSHSSFIIIGVAVGLIIGIAASASDAPALHLLIAAIQPLGTLWVNALQMTAIPLVLSLLVGSVVSAAERGRFRGIAGSALLNDSRRKRAEKSFVAALESGSAVRGRGWIGSLPDGHFDLEQEAPDDDADREQDEREQSELGDLGLQHTDLRDA